VLLELRIKDLGIIEDVDLKLDRGLNIITGETGAGKSLIIDAVELLLTGTSSSDVIRHGSDEARIEGIFSLSNNQDFTALRSLLCEKDLSSDEDVLILNCDIRKGRPGTVKINGVTSTKTLFRQVGQLLIDIHGQSEHSSLLNTANHLDFLDYFAHTLEHRNNFEYKATKLDKIKSELISLSQKQQDSIRQEEFLRYQIDEIQKANLLPDEDEELEKESRIISFSEKLKEYADKIYQSLYENNSAQYSGSALVSLNEAGRFLKKLVDLDPSLKQNLDFLDKTIYGIEELARDIHSYKEKLQENTSRLDEIESRLELLRNLKRKYGKTIPEILAYKEKASIELNGIQNSADKIKSLKNEMEFLKKEMGIIALNLSYLRCEAAQKLKQSMKIELDELEMAHMQFDISINRTSSSEGIGGSEGYFTFNATGIDSVEFMVSTNPGEPITPLAKISSTGEISRFTLALKSALSEADHIPVLIFDEIDIGVGGRSGDILGKKLWMLARNHQVICVTHLPQIAVYADRHFYVHKTTNNNRTISTLEKLSSDLRLNELASMLAGPDFSRLALKNAEELIKKAEIWKNSFTKEPVIKPSQLSF
jgi:DNA repair protein RecN (Recombination protein N)